MQDCYMKLKVKNFNICLKNTFRMSRKGNSHRASGTTFIFNEYYTWIRNLFQDTELEYKFLNDAYICLKNGTRSDPCHSERFRPKLISLKRS